MNFSTEDPSNYTVILNHMITNKFELYAYSILYALLLVLYIYECYKIYNYYLNYRQETKAYRQFEILFCFATLLRMTQIEYSLMGFLIDGQQDLLIDKKQLLFCDSLFKFDSRFFCYSNYKVYGIFTSIGLITFNISVQCISMFWMKQLSPQSFLFNSIRKTQKGIAFYFFTLINLTQLVLSILAFYYNYNNDVMFVLKIYECVSCGMTFIYLLIAFKKYQQHNQDQKDHWIISIGVFFCIVSKLSYLIYRFLQSKDQHNQVEEEYQKNTLMSIMIFTYIMFDQLIFRVLVVKLF